MFCCERCGYESKFKRNLVAHLERKKPCEIRKSNISREELLSKLEDGKERTYECDKCEKFYATRQSLSVHRKKCSGDRCSSKDAIKTLQAQIEMLQKELATVKQLGSGTTNNTNIMDNSITIQNLQINSPALRTFGNESMDHITNDFLKSCVLQTYDGLKAFLHELHWNPDVPENHNIRFKSNKQKSLEIYKDDRWIECNQTTTLDELIKKGYKVLFQSFIQNMDSDPQLQDYKAEIHDWFSRVSSHSGIPYFNLRRDICLLIKDKTMYALAKTS